MTKFVRSKVLVSAVALALSAGGAGLAFAVDTAGTDAPTATVTEGLWLIEFAEPGLLYFTGDGEQPQATAPAATGQRRLDVHSPAAVQYQARLSAAQDAHVAAIGSRLGRSVEAVHRYAITHSGIAVQLTEDEAAQIRNLPGVASVEKEAVYQLDTHRGPTFIGATTIWDGSSAPGGNGSMGQGVTIGVFDTGANLTHPSFAPMGAACGYDYAKPKLVALDCSTANCASGSPADADSHGSHTASTSGGNFVSRDPTSAGLPLRDISGVAPCANLRTYRVCFPNGCTGSAITNAINRAIADGIDVANFSLGPNVNGQLNPWTESTDRRALDMVNAGIFVSMSAGNTRSSPVINPPAEVKHVGPWNITVANSGHDGVPRADGSMQVTGPTPVPPALASLVLTPADVPPPSAGTGVVVRHVASNNFGCDPFAPGTFAGAAALVSRGGTPEACAFAIKVANAVAAGAHTVIIYNNVAGAISPATNAHGDTRVATLTQTDGQALANFITANGATPTVVTINPAPLTTANVLESGSLRGPNLCCNGNGGMNVTKPDITAPGTNIYAASSAANGYTNMSGTSMSSPHVAGAGALVRATQPNWTPVEVNSALMLTATGAGQLMPDGTTPATPDEVGSGMVNLRRAALAGLVMNETFANFVAANPNSGGQPHTLNTASLRNVGCTGSCQWTRTFRNTLTVPTSWTVAAVNVPAGLTVNVSPTSFSFTGAGVPVADALFFGGDFEVPGAPPETQALTVTATPTATLANIVFAEVVLTEANSLSPPLRLTVAVRGAP
ncbi:S8 family serine peptidase [Dokdonella koreensis]|uniref:Peptidase S8/S53 subtilisin kexin sedolisin n=1 Tax=Dokdonella koreensis DS-123 TaxID=1300342 RepID=A0A160DV20_9GAMM|nr:S8 family serine peptidase [Dokdonella koreensis]ANB18367.1 peptidase S8/S53 subtilisin kexin sedolisin [Dokdonella koreensis DS-123]